MAGNLLTLKNGMYWAARMSETQLEIEIADFLLKNKDVLKENCHMDNENYEYIGKITKYFHMNTQDYYESYLIDRLKFQVSKHFNDFEKVMEICDIKWLKKILGDEFFYY